MSERSTRRDFLGRGALATLAAGAAWPAAAEAPKETANDGPADLVVLGGTVHTVDDRMPKAEAFAIKNGRFIAVGKSDEIRKLAGSSTQTIDATGLTIVPGFIDAHCHPASAGLAELLDVNCDKPTIADIKKGIAERAAKTAADNWVFGFKYDDTKLKDERPLSRQDLDEAAPRHPVRVTHRGGHTCIYNSVAFKLAGVTAKTPDPDGGKFGRDDKGELTGFVAEKANDVFDRHARRAGATAAQRQAGIKLISELMTAVTVLDSAGYQAALSTAEWFA